MIRHLNQTHLAFLVKMQKTKKHYQGKPVYCAPADKAWNGKLITYSNTIEFVLDGSICN